LGCFDICLKGVLGIDVFRILQLLFAHGFVNFLEHFV